jgi:hypothetical protein
MTTKQFFDQSLVHMAVSFQVLELVGWLRFECQNTLQRLWRIAAIRGYYNSPVTIIAWARWRCSSLTHTRQSPEPVIYDAYEGGTPVPVALPHATPTCLCSVVTAILSVFLTPLTINLLIHFCKVYVTYRSLF